ncbi:Nn.00g063890.m01.CDS01 [Neocucurbitaria sp. VM-36]
MADTPVELGYEYLRSLRVPALDSTAIPSEQRLLLARLERSFDDSDVLDNKIHPLFQYYNWLDLEYKHYQMMLPALRLATLLVQQPALMQWWKHTLYGKLSYDLIKGHYLAPSFIESTQVAHSRALEILNVTLPHVLRIGFCLLDTVERQLDGMSFGSTTTFAQFCAGDHSPRPMVFNNPRIMLHSHYRWDLEYLQAHGSADDFEHIHLRIAITLCHELAHIIWKYRLGGDVKYTPFGAMKEPLHQLNDEIVELGHSWETFVFGGSIWAIDQPGYLITYYTPQEVLENPTAIKTRIVVPRWWIHIWFRKSFWQHFHNLFSAGELRIPNEVESGYVFRKQSPKESLEWTLFIHGAPMDVKCLMPEHAPYIMWNIIRPRKGAEERTARNMLEPSELPRPEVSEGPPENEQMKSLSDGEGESKI